MIAFEPTTMSIRRSGSEIRLIHVVQMVAKVFLVVASWLLESSWWLLGCYGVSRQLLMYSGWLLGGCLGNLVGC